MPVARLVDTLPGPGKSASCVRGDAGGFAAGRSAATTAVSPMAVSVMAVVAAVVGKVGGGYLGAWLGGEGHGDRLKLGVLLNTRGLTELVVVQAGYSAGLITAPMFLVLAVMAVVTTVITGPWHALLDRRSAQVDVPEPAAV